MKLLEFNNYKHHFP